VIWHTQGSGKSILMVLLAKWLLEHDPDARILVVTDRDELDKQIEGVMKNAGVIGADSPSPRITSRAEFVAEAGRRHATPAVRAAPQVRRGRPERGNRRRVQGASTCSWTSATAPRAAT
jgi:type I restriction enzyme R subunit